MAPRPTISTFGNGAWPRATCSRIAMFAMPARFACSGQTLVRELFQGPISPRQGSAREKRLLQGDRGPHRKGANMMGMDQDDILLAPWTTIKYRVTGSSATTANQSAAARPRVNHHDGEFSQPDLPQCQNQLYPVPSATQPADTPQPVRFINVDQILTAARPPEIPAAIGRSPRYCGSGTGLARGSRTISISGI